MRITKWVEFSQEVEISLGAEDISSLLSESLISEGQETVQGVLYALNSIATFLRAIGDKQIAAMRPIQRRTVATFLAQQSGRFQNLEPAGDAAAATAAPNNEDLKG